MQVSMLNSDHQCRTKARRQQGLWQSEPYIHTEAQSIFMLQILHMYICPGRTFWGLSQNVVADQGSTSCRIQKSEGQIGLGAAGS